MGVSRGDVWRTTWSIWLVVIAWLFSPFWFNPLAFDRAKLKNDFTQVFDGSPLSRGLQSDLNVLLSVAAVDGAKGRQHDLLVGVVVDRRALSPGHQVVG